MRRAFGQRLREAREAAGLTQQQVADLTGIDRKHVGEIEGGRHNFTVDTMTVLARAVGLEPQILLSPVRQKKD